MKQVKQHFEEEARVFDETILRLIPYYEEMLDALVVSLPFDRDRTIHVVDLGCGTGAVARRVKDAFPNANITCIDLAENMLEMAKTKLGSDRTVRYQLANFETYEFDLTYDVAVSSLALHHLVDDRSKIQFYKKIHHALNPGGVFYNADLVLSANDSLQTQYMNKWRDHMRQQISEAEIEDKWIAKHLEEDRPANLMDQLAWLQNIGFAEVDVTWKYYNFAVYGGRKAV